MSGTVIQEEESMIFRPSDRCRILSWKISVNGGAPVAQRGWTVRHEVAREE